MINISMDGVQDAVETIREIIVPWRRKNAERKAKLEITLRQAEIHRLNVESMLSKAQAEKEIASTKIDHVKADLINSQIRKTEAEAKLIMAQANKTLAEAEKERSSLKRSQIELALQIIDKYSQDLDNVEKMEYVIKLMPILEQLTSGNLKLP